MPLDEVVAIKPGEVGEANKQLASDSLRVSDLPQRECRLGYESIGRGMQFQKLKLPDAVCASSPSRNIQSLGLETLDASHRVLSAAEDISGLTVKALLELLGNTEPERRIAAVKELVKRVPREDKETQTSIVRGIVRSLTSDENMLVKAASADGLGNINRYYLSVTETSKEVSSALVQTLYLSGKDSEFARLSAVTALERLSYKESASDISKILLNDSDTNVRVASARALGVFAAYFDVNGSNQIFWRRIRDEVVPPLLQALKGDQDSAVRKQVVQSLEYIGHPNTIDSLINSLEDKDESVRSAAAISIGNFFQYRNKPAVYDSQAVNKLASVVGNPAEGAAVREGAIYSLGVLEARDTLPLIRAAINDKDPYVRLTAISVLGELKDPQSIPDLRKLLDQTGVQSDSRMLAAAALANIGDSYSLPFLVSVLQDKSVSPYDRVQIAADALGKLGNSEAIQPLLNIYEELGNYDPSFRSRLISAIVGASRNDVSAKSLVAQKFSLTSKKLDTWNQFGVLVLEGNEAFSDEMLDRLHKTLESLSKEELKAVNVISSDVQLKPGIALGVTLAEVEFHTNTIYFRLKELKLRTGKEFSDTAIHELGHLIYPAMKVENKVDMDRRYWASADEMFSDPRNLFRSADFFVSDYADYNTDEFFAEARLSYIRNTRQMVQEASTKKRDHILAQAKALTAINSDIGEDSKRYANVFQLGQDGTIVKSRAPIGSDGLPIF